MVFFLNFFSLQMLNNNCLTWNTHGPIRTHHATKIESHRPILTDTNRFSQYGGRYWSVQLQRGRYGPVQAADDVIDWLT